MRLFSYFAVCLFLCFSEASYSTHHIFMKAIENNDVRMVRRIIREGVDLNRTIDPRGRYTPLQYAALKGAADVVALLLFLGISPNPKSQEVRRNHGPYNLRDRPYRRFLQAKCASQYYHHGQQEAPPLYLAAQSGNTACVQTLISSGLNVAHVTDPGWGINTALHGAAGSGDVEVAKIILRNTPQLINFVQLHGYSALYTAFCNYRFDFFLFLLQAGANPDIENLQRQFLIHLAVQSSEYPYVIVLIQHGVDLSITNNRGETPLDIAHSNDDEYLTGVLTPAYICNAVAVNDNTHTVLPSLQEWVAHYIRMFFSYQQILQLPLPNHLIIFILGTYGQNNME